MKPFERGYLDPAQTERTKKACLDRWIEGKALEREQWPVQTVVEAIAAIDQYFADMMRDEMIWMNDVYQVNIRQPSKELLHLSIKRIDKKPIHDWRDIQQIKNELVGPENEGIELYPAESRRIDTANQFHIFCAIDTTFRFPIGFDGGRHVHDESIAGSVNRPLDDGAEWPWCDACKSYHHPKNLTCFKLTRKEKA